MKILFVMNLSHNLKSLKELKKRKNKNITELFGSSNLPLGIMSIQAYITKNNIDVETEIIDLNVLFMKKIIDIGIEEGLSYIIENYTDFLMEEIKKSISDKKLDVIGISSLFDKSLPTLKILCDEVKRCDDDVLIIAGGHPVNNLYKELLNEKDYLIDAICIGEGELPFHELLQQSNKVEFLERSGYFVTQSNLNSGMKYVKKFVTELDDIPIYDYERYFDKYGIDVLELHNNSLDSSNSFNRQAIIMTSRGCPYNCIFCASKSVHNQSMRANSIERIKEEIDLWVDHYNVDSIGFTDDHILYDINRAIEICDYAGSKGIDIRFPNGLAIAPINKALVDCFVRNGIKEVQLALESGSERILETVIRKPLNLFIARKVFDLFINTEIFVRIFLVIGFPEETVKDIEDGLEFLRKANFHWASISNPTPISGSRLLETSLKKGFIQDYKYDDVSFFSSSYINDEIIDKYNGNLKYTVNLDVNFVHNPYMRLDKYQEAAKRFEMIIKSYPNHAFGYYYLYKCYEKMGQSESTLLELSERYNKIIENDEMWRSYKGYFKLDVI